MKNSEVRKQEGLRKPVSLVEACEILGDSKNLQDNAEAKLKVGSGFCKLRKSLKTLLTLKVLEDAAASAQKMTSHQEADGKVSSRISYFSFEIQGCHEQRMIIHPCRLQTTHA